MYISSSEGFTLTGDAVARLVALADGSMRDAVSLLDQCVSDGVVDLARVQDTLGLVGNQDLLKLARMVADRDVTGALLILDELYNDGRDMTALLNEITALVRDLLVFKISPDSHLLSAGLDKNALSGLTKKFSSERLFFCLDMLKNILSALSRSGSSKLTIEMCLIKMCGNSVLTPAVSYVNEDEIKSPTQSTNPQKSPEQSQYSKNEILTAAVIDGESEEEPADETDNTMNLSSRPKPHKRVSADESSICSDFWVKILELLNREPSVRVLLNDSSKVKGVLKDNLLTVNFTDSYTAEQIKHGFSELIKDTAEKVLGHNIVINIEVVESVDSDEIKRSKLDSLSAFDIVSFN
jgi:DNA polymerase-3 subunit gamma/tau